jgi:hypothetical protein
LLDCDADEILDVMSNPRDNVSFSLTRATVNAVSTNPDAEVDPAASTNRDREVVVRVSIKSLNR